MVNSSATRFRKELDRLQVKHDTALAKIGYYWCYDGCPDTALQAVFLDREALAAESDPDISELEAHADAFTFLWKRSTTCMLGDASTRSHVRVSAVSVVPERGIASLWTCSRT